MKALRFVVAAACWIALASPICFAFETGEKSSVSSAPDMSEAGWSSSAATNDFMAVTSLPAPKTGLNMITQAISAGRTARKPFSAVGVAVKVGVEGIGFDVATPLARKFNLRGGASFFSYQGSLTEDGIKINPDVRFRKAAASLDYYPFGGSFRISPGYVFYNGNHATATAMVPGGQTFDLNDTTYTSSLTDPVRGSAIFDFGRKQAPSFTVGWGNMIPRKGGHWSVPFEIGFEYIGKPTLTYNLAGTACSSQGCGTFSNDPEIQADLKAEQDELNNDIAPLRFYPIVSIGLAYKF